MRVLVVTPEYPPHAAGGILKYYQSIVPAWRQAGADVAVLAASPFSAFDAYSHDGVGVQSVSLEAIEERAGRLTHLAATPLYRRWIAAGLAAADWLRPRVESFDVIETTDFGLLFAPLASVANRPPLAVTLHGSLGQISDHEPPATATALDMALARFTEAAVLPRVDALHALSAPNAEEWKGRLMRDVEVITPPLPVPESPRQHPDSEYAAVVVGRIQSWKGPELLCRALRVLGSATLPDLRIAWVGRDTMSGPQGQSMSSWLAASYPDVWGKRIVPIATRTQREVAELQASARFVIVPSTWDTFNYTLPEAMGLGCVVLGSTGAGSSSLIDHGRTGFRFAPDDPAGLAELLVAAHSMTDAERRTMAAAARTTILTQLAPSTAAQASLAALGRAAGGRPQPAPPDWISDFFAPQDSSATEWGHLENVSIRALASHLKTRVARRIVG